MTDNPELDLLYRLSTDQAISLNVQAHMSTMGPDGLSILNKLLQYDPDKKKDDLGFWDGQGFTIEDALKPRPPAQYVINGVLPKPSLNVFFGSPGSLKSFVLADMAICVAAGIPWLQPVPGQNGTALEVTQAPVVWIDCDNGLDLTHERFGALARAYGITGKIPLYYYSMPDPWPDFQSPDFVKNMIEKFGPLQPGMIVFDGLILISGGADENSPEMAPVMRHLRILSEELRACTNVLHHPRKSSVQSGGLRKGDSLRGHGSIESSLDYAFYCERLSEQDIVTIETTKSRRRSISAMRALFTYENDERDELYTARFFGQTGGGRTDAIFLQMKSILSDGALNQGDLINALIDTGISRNDARAAVKKAIAAEVIKSKKGAKNANLYEVVGNE